MCSPGRGRRRSSLGPRSARAYAPGAITNFFEIDYGPSKVPRGATGGGYILSKGALTTATFADPGAGDIVTEVNGDRGYNARTTRRGVAMLIAERGFKFGTLRLSQTVQIPIGSGFGASAASATSAVLAVGSASRMRIPKRELALYAHRAEILEQTGLGTVSVVYDAVGAGAIVKAGPPGDAEFINVRVPKTARIVTAFLGPFDKKEALSSESTRGRINKLGREALTCFLSDPTLESLVSAGEKFSRDVGFESTEVKKLIRLAKSAGATGASQNMIGYSVHSLAHGELAEKVASALRGYSPRVRVDVFKVASRKAGLVSPNRRKRGPS